jgi:AcrR family transcriptional regulator
MPIQKAATVKGRHRQKRILAAAKSVFLEQGFERANVSEIMARAGGSMSTLYRVYGSKLGLFEAMIEQSTMDLFPMTEDEQLWCDDVRRSLTRFGEKMIAVLTQTEARAIRCIALSVSSAESQAIRQAFYTQGPQRVTGLLAAYLETQKQQGHIRVVDTEVAAAQFIEMLKAPWYHKAEFGFGYEPHEPSTALKQAVEFFSAALIPAVEPVTDGITDR